MDVRTGSVDVNDEIIPEDGSENEVSFFGGLQEAFWTCFKKAAYTKSNFLIHFRMKTFNIKRAPKAQ